MINILVVGQTPPPIGGQAIMIEKMLNGDYDGVRLHHIRMRFSNEMDEVGKFNFRKIIELFRVIGLIIYSRFAYKADVLYYPPAGPAKIPIVRDMAILIVTRWLFRKTIFHFHASGLTNIYNELSPPMRFLFRLAYFTPDVSLRLSEYNSEDGKNLKAEKEYIIPYGIEDEFKPGMKNKSSGNDSVNILFVGILCESKGVKILLKASKILLEKGLAFHINLMGKFESAAFEEEIRDFIRTNRLTHCVTCLGVLTGDKKHNAFSAADIFCFPTFFEAESFGVVLVEPLSFGLPIVATHWRGIPSVVDDGTCGYLVPVKDVVATARKLEYLINNPELCQVMGEQGRRRYLEFFTLDKYYQRLQEVFKELAPV